MKLRSSIRSTRCSKSVSTVGKLKTKKRQVCIVRSRAKPVKSRYGSINSKQRSASKTSKSSSQLIGRHIGQKESTPLSKQYDPQKQEKQGADWVYMYGHLDHHLKPNWVVWECCTESGWEAYDEKDTASIEEVKYTNVLSVPFLE